MIKKSKNPFLTINHKDFSPMLEGLDILINFSIITFLSNFLFPELDLRLSIIFTTLILFISFLSKFISFIFLKRFKVFFSKIIQNSDLFLAILYIIAILLPQGDYFNFQVGILIFVRFFIGTIYSLTNPIFLNNLQEMNFNLNHQIKYWLFFIFGMILGGILFSILNEIFSNNQLNNWAWKVSYVFLVFLVLIKFIISVKFRESLKVEFDKYEINYNFLTIDNFASFFKNFSIFVPLLSFVLFCSSNWLPKFCNPENMQFLNYNSIHIILLLIFSIFLFPLIQLIGQRRSSYYISSFIILICLVFGITKVDSSYGIDLLKFFLTLFSSISLCVFLNNVNLKEPKSNHGKIFFAFNFPFFILYFFIPFLFYYFIHFSISYNIIYLLNAVIFIIYLFSRIYKIKI